MGGRDGVISALSLAALDQKQQYFLRLLADPLRVKDSLATIAKDADIPPAQIITLWREASAARAHALASGRLSDNLVKVVDDVIDKSVDREVECPDCRGAADEKSPCLRCRGRGTVLRSSDLDRQKMIFESTGLLKKGGGVNVAVNQQVGVMQPGAFFSRFVKASDPIAYDITPEKPSDAD